jgi:hypothetical protein
VSDAKYIYIYIYGASCVNDVNKKQKTTQMSKDTHKRKRENEGVRLTTRVKK